MSKIKVKTSAQPASVSRAAVKAAVEAVYGNSAGNIAFAQTSPDVFVRVTKRASVKALKAGK